MWYRPTHKFDESHDGQTVTVNAGDLIEITLPHFSVDQWGFPWPSKFTGNVLYNWMGAGAVSVNNMQTLTFYARCTGTEILDLERKQLPGYGNAVIKVFNLTVQVN